MAGELGFRSLRREIVPAAFNANLRCLPGSRTLTQAPKPRKPPGCLRGPCVRVACHAGPAHSALLCTCECASLRSPALCWQPPVLWGIRELDPVKGRRQHCVVQVNAAVHIPLRLLDDAEGACCRAWQPRGSSRSQHAEQRAQRCRRRGRRRGSGCRRIGSSACCRRAGRGCRRRCIQWHPRSQTLNHYIVETLEGAPPGQQQCLQQLRPGCCKRRVGGM